MHEFKNFMLFCNMTDTTDWLLAALSWLMVAGMGAVLTWVVVSIYAIFQLTR